MGNDGCFRKGETLCSVISIHVPSWGTTYPYSGICTEASISIHVPSWGTTVRKIFIWYCSTFQSTFPRGERPSFKIKNRIALIFQSTFPRGERLPTSAFCEWERDISIHVPSWGTTLKKQEPRRTSSFQSTFPRGERRESPR